MQPKIIAAIIIVIILIIGIFVAVLLLNNNSPPPPVYNSPPPPVYNSPPPPIYDAPPPPPPQQGGYWSNGEDVFTITILSNTEARIVNYKKTTDISASVAGSVIRAFEQVGTHNADKISWSGGQIWTKTSSPIPPAKNINAWQGKWMNPADNNFAVISKIDNSNISIDGSKVLVVGDTFEFYGHTALLSGGKINWSNGVTWIPLAAPNNLSGWVGTWLDVNNIGALVFEQVDNSRISINKSVVLVNGDSIYIWGLIGTLSGGKINWSNGVTWIPFPPINFSEWIGDWYSKDNGDINTISKANNVQIGINNIPFFVINNIVHTNGAKGSLEGRQIIWTNGNIWTPYTGVSSNKVAVVTNVYESQVDLWVGNWQYNNTVNKIEKYHLGAININTIGPYYLTGSSVNVNGMTGTIQPNNTIM